ncbi:uncharacterized protein PHALS_06283 [Plasmopara halstedii]|uniref:Uncharacterized protein n=1 Tax=Plasmopara halstedii TaxID=4781 RepID=A0A0P1B343_PLAHL|nr:uncharacterized protein PHALS_06283 [Plasmopara halstedii]CEG48463.1 hypothetical protein PHALS_06283 [Plasmopara halstedii]|eukprot:XP_024584832.1 hypothetical protein PHALS_06283 [Plasmopara halstedii]
MRMQYLLLAGANFYLMNAEQLTKSNESINDLSSRSINTSAMSTQLTYDENDSLQNVIKPTSIMVKGDLSQATRLIIWLQYVAKLLKKKGLERVQETEIYILLSETYTDAQLATLFERVQKDSLMHDLAERMLAFMLSKFTNSQVGDGAWPDSKDTPKKIFKELRLEDANLVDNILFAGWIRYAIAYYENVTPHYPDSVLHHESICYEIYNFLREMKSIGELPNIFDRLPFAPNLERIHQDLKRVAHWELEKKFQLLQKDPLTPQQLFKDKKVKIGLNLNFLQWLRYCDAYMVKMQKRNDQKCLCKVVGYLATIKSF